MMKTLVLIGIVLSLALPAMAKKRKRYQFKNSDKLEKLILTPEQIEKLPAHLQAKYFIFISNFNSFIEVAQQNGPVKVKVKPGPGWKMINKKGKRKKSAALEADEPNIFEQLSNAMGNIKIGLIQEAEAVWNFLAMGVARIGGSNFLRSFGSQTLKPMLQRGVAKMKSWGSSKPTQPSQQLLPAPNRVPTRGTKAEWQDSLFARIPPGGGGGGVVTAQGGSTGGQLVRYGANTPWFPTVTSRSIHWGRVLGAASTVSGVGYVGYEVGQGLYEDEALTPTAGTDDSGVGAPEEPLPASPIYKAEELPCLYGGRASQYRLDFHKAFYCERPREHMNTETCKGTADHPKFECETFGLSANLKSANVPSYTCIDFYPNRDLTVRCTDAVRRFILSNDVKSLDTDEYNSWRTDFLKQLENYWASTVGPSGLTLMDYCADKNNINNGEQASECEAMQRLTAELNQYGGGIIEVAMTGELANDDAGGDPTGSSQGGSDR